MITLIKLHRFRRLDQSRIKTIEINFTGGLHLFIGSNGSGKTSVMQETTFLPGLPSNYHLGGYKQVEGIYDGIRYRATSYFDERSYHSLLTIAPDGSVTELNKVGLISTQRELVDRLFGITSTLQEVLGRSSESKGFSQMSLLKRKDWIAQISRIDYDYAISFHKKILANIKSAKAIKAYLADRQSRLTGTLVAHEADDLLAVSNRANADLAILTDLIKKIDERTPTDPTGILDINKTIREAKDAHDDVRTALAIARTADHPYADTASLRSELDAVRTQHQALKQSLSVLAAEQRGLQSGLDAHAASAAVDVAQTTADLKDLDAKLKATPLPALAAYWQPGWDPTALASELDVIAAESFSPDTYTYSAAALNDARGTHARLTRVATDLKSTLAHLQPSHAVDPKCPHCLKPIKPDVDLDRIATLKAQLADTDVDLGTAGRALEVLEWLSNTHSRLDSAKARYPGATNTVGDAPTFWGILDTTNAWRDPVAIKHLVASTTAATAILATRTSWAATRRDLHAQLDAVPSDLAGTLQQLKTASVAAAVKHATLKRCDTELEALGAALAKATASWDLMDAHGVTLDRLAIAAPEDAIADDWRTLRLTLQQSHDDLLASQLDRTRLLERHRVSKKEYDSVTLELADQTKVLANQQIVEQAVSPKTGLIAEAINGAVGGMTESMNEIIASIWDSPMVLQPPRTDAETFFIDYKFPVDFGLPVGVKDDISRGSKAMREVADMAFAVMASESAGRQVLPVYLDEFALSLDDVHVEQSVSSISSLVSERGLQVFIISHNHALYGALPYVETTALCLHNVNDLKADDVNATTKIEYYD
ncbi:MAG: hypothetical protein KAG66_03600 [Methylococcales bacterium]|nr:hypothetical protein [Methylococcales bacterium]